MFIAIDFDGTIVTHEYPEIGREIGAIPWIKEFQKREAKIILFTMRSGETLSQAVEWLEKNGIVLYGINSNPTQKDWTGSPKAYANLYIDDAAFGCPLVFPISERPYVDWENVGPKVLEMLGG